MVPATVRVELPENVSPLVGRSQLVGHADPSLKLRLTLVLAPRAGTHLRADAESRSRGHTFLSRAEYVARYSPTVDDYERLKSFLGESRGVRVTRISGEQQSLGIDATVGDIERLFDTTINLYTYAGRQFYANATNPKLQLGWRRLFSISAACRTRCR